MRASGGLGGSLSMGRMGRMGMGGGLVSSMFSSYAGTPPLSRSNSGSKSRGGVLRRNGSGSGSSKNRDRGLVARCNDLLFRRRLRPATVLLALGALLLLVLLVDQATGGAIFSPSSSSTPSALDGSGDAVLRVQQRKAALLRQWRMEAHAAHNHPPGYVEARERERAQREEAAEILAAAAISLPDLPSDGPDAPAPAAAAAGAAAPATDASADSSPAGVDSAPARRLLRGVSAALRRYGEKVQAGEQVLHVPAVASPAPPTPTNAPAASPIRL